MNHETTNLFLFPAAKKHPDIVSAEEFLKWARSDLKGGGRRECGNALGNIKKALHAQIDNLIYKTHARYGNNWDPRCEYSVPNKSEVEAYMEIAEMRLERVRDRYSFQPVGIVGLRLKELKVTSSAPCTVKFLKPGKMSYFWDTKKVLVTIDASGDKNEVPYSDYTWEELVNIEGKHIKRSYNGFITVPRSELTSVYKKYVRWIAANRERT
jgi:hypothetical protein